jgi:hypothetical protein
MHDRREWAVINLPSRCSHAEGKIAVLAIGGREKLVKAAEFVPQGARDEDRASRNIVGLSHVIVLGLVRVVRPAIVPARTVAPNDSARFLKRPVGKKQFRPGQASVRESIKDRKQRFEPAFPDQRVVVEQEQEIALRKLGAPVACLEKAEVGRIDLQQEPRHFSEQFNAGLARSVVHDDDFEWSSRRDSCDRLQTLQMVVSQFEIRRS